MATVSAKFQINSFIRTSFTEFLVTCLLVGDYAVLLRNYVDSDFAKSRNIYPISPKISCISSKCTKFCVSVGKGSRSLPAKYKSILLKSEYFYKGEVYVIPFQNSMIPKN